MGGEASTLESARAIWQDAEQELNQTIGIDADAASSAGANAVLGTGIDLARFRAAVKRERAARIDYAAALRSIGHPLPDDFLWDIEK